MYVNSDARIIEMKFNICKYIERRTVFLSKSNECMCCLLIERREEKKRNIVDSHLMRLLC